MLNTPPRLSFARSGAGEPLVLIHGIGSRRQVWDCVLPGLDANREVFAVDLPGFGMSSANAVRPSVDGYADAMAAFVRSMGLERPHVAGHSLGGAVALELGRRGLARSVVAFAPIGFWGATGTMWCQGALRALRSAGPRVRPVVPRLANRSVGRWALAAAFFGRPGRLTPRRVVEDADAFAAAEAFDPACELFGEHVFTGVGALDTISVTIAWGTRDVLLPHWAQSRRAKSALPSARHIRMPGCGHVSMVDDPAACRLLLLDSW